MNIHDATFIDLINKSGKVGKAQKQEQYLCAEMQEKKRQ